MTMTTTEQTDRDGIRNAFRELRKKGYIARMNYMCCGSCAWYEIGQKTIFGFQKDIAEEDVPRKVVFYTRQANDAFKDTRSKYYSRGRTYTRNNLQHDLYLQWDGDGKEIVEALREQGLTVEWNGTGEQAICLKATPKENRW